MKDQEKSPVTASDAHPSGDARFKMLDVSMKQYRDQPDAPIEVLPTTREILGHLDHDLLLYHAGPTAWRPSTLSSPSPRRVSTRPWSAWGRPATSRGPTPAWRLSSGRGADDV
jgi:hypothetical protein